MQAWQTYRSLNSEQKQILASKQLDVSRPVDELIALVKPLAACDTVANKSQTRFGCSFGLAIVAAIVLTIIFSNIGWSTMLLAVMVGVLAVAAVCGWAYFWLRGIDVSNNLRSFVVPVLTLFKEDVDPRHPVHLRLDLGKPTAAHKKTGESAPFAQGVYHKVVDHTYVDPWMDAEAVLVDGTKLSWSVTDRIRERKKTKRNARGKYKSKTKYTKKSDLDVTLTLRTKNYDVAGADVSGDGRKSKVQVEKSIRTDSLDPIDPRALIDAITEVYRNARPAKKEATA